MPGPRSLNSGRPTRRRRAALEVRGAVLRRRRWSTVPETETRLGSKLSACGGGRGRRLLLALVEDDADLVGEDLLALAHVVERRRVDDLVELRDEEEVGEDGELHDEVAHLVARCAEPDANHDVYFVDHVTVLADLQWRSGRGI